MEPPSPIPVPDHVRTLIVFGGTFDPPTRAHVDLPLAARDAARADWLLYVPAARSPFKTDGPEATDAQRIDMLRLALAAHEQRASVSTYEIDATRSGEPSYTLATLTRFREALPPACAMRLLIGADQAASFHRWREPARVVELAEPLVMLRPPVETADELLASMAPHWHPAELEAWRARIVEVPLLDVSATHVRDLLDDARRHSDELKALLPPGVYDYIIEHALYTPK